MLTTVHRSIKKGEINAEIVFVFSNREQGEDKESDAFFRLVRRYRIPLVYQSSNRFKQRFEKGWRSRFEKEAMRRLEGFHPDLCVLAGYMLIVGAEMCRRYPMINLHPAAPGGPKGTWQEVIWGLMEEEQGELE